MPRRYQKVTKRGFERELSKFVKFDEVNPKGVNEVVYDCPLPVDDLTVRIFSTIEKGHSRAKGQDAIRTVIWDHNQDCPIGGEIKTLRLAPSKSNPEGWIGNMRPKIRKLYKNWRDFNKVCPKCGNRMRIQEPKPSDDWTSFWTCTSYPNCDKTINNVDVVDL